jgi:hypothetical protein
VLELTLENNGTSSGTREPVAPDERSVKYFARVALIESYHDDVNL